MTNRPERARRLRPVVAEAVKRTSLRDVADEIGVSHNLIHKFLGGGTPFDKSLDRIEEWALRVGAIAAEAADMVVLNYEALGIDLPGYERLRERSRQVFDRFMYELLGRGLRPGDMEELGRGLLAPISHANTLHKGRDASDATSEEDQLMILNGLIPAVRRIAERLGR